MVKFKSKCSHKGNKLVVQGFTHKTRNSADSRATKGDRANGTANNQKVFIKGKVQTFGDYFTKRDKAKYIDFLAISHGIQKPIIEKLVDNYILIINNRSKFRGMVDSCKFAKQLAGVSLRLAGSQKWGEIPFCKCDDQGFPLIISAFKPFLKGDLDSRRCALSILSLYKVVNTYNKEFSLTTITQPDVGEYNNSLPYFVNKFNIKQFKDKEELNRKIQTCWRNTLEREFPRVKREERLTRLTELNKLHISSASGPNGPALISQPIDWKALTSQPQLIEALKDMIKLTNNRELGNIVKQFEQSDGERITPHKGGYKPIVSKLSLKQESGGKTRVFAIGDWFCQSALEGLRHYLTNWLNNQPEDGTSSHNRVAEIGKLWTSDIKIDKIFSTDLTAATDRIPTKMYVEILEQMFGVQFAKVWRTLMVDRPFLDPDGKVEVRYAKGQPMGFLSSWSMMAVWHHLIMRTAMEVLGLIRTPDSTSYLIIGDDNACIGADLAHLYRYMLELCDVPTSPLKGFSPETELNNPLQGKSKGSIEIAKRVFLGGDELTPVSPDTFKEGLRFPSSMPALLADMHRRGYKPAISDPPHRIAQLGYKPNWSLLYMYFPLKPASYTEVEVDEQGIVNLPLHKGLVWHGCNTEVLYKDLYNAVNQRLKESQIRFKTLLSTIQKSAEFEQFVTSRWNIASKVLPSILQCFEYEFLDMAFPDIAAVRKLYQSGLVMKDEPSSEYKAPDNNKDRLHDQTNYKALAEVLHKAIDNVIAIQDCSDVLFDNTTSREERIKRNKSQLARSIQRKKDLSGIVKILSKITVERKLGITQEGDQSSDVNVDTAQALAWGDKYYAETVMGEEEQFDDDDWEMVHEEIPEFTFPVKGV